MTGLADADPLFALLAAGAGWGQLAAAPAFLIALYVPLRGPRGGAWTAAAAAGLWLFLLKAVQHALFANQAYDLGIFTNVAWNLAFHGEFRDSIKGMDYLGDHWEPLLALAAPLFRLLPSALTLTALQSAALGAAVVPLYALARRRCARPESAALACAIFVAHPYLHRVHAYDFHTIAFAVPLFLWALDAAERGRPRLAAGLALAALGLREDAALGSAAVGLMLWSGGRRRLGAALAALAAAWAALAVLYWMPARLGGWTNTHLAFFALPGGGFAAAARGALAAPGALLSGLLGGEERWRGLLLYLASFAFLPLAAPRLAPLWALPAALCFVAAHEPMRQFDRHYAALSLPFLAYAALEGARRLRERGWEPPRAAWAAALGLCLACLRPYWAPVPARRLTALRRAVDSIPAGAAVAAQTNLTPALACRREITMFPRLAPGTRFVALDLGSPGIPPAERRGYAEFLRANRARIAFADAGVYVLGR